MSKITHILKRLTQSDAFRIYFWPIFISWLIFPLLAAMLIFGKLEPGSRKEFAFVSIGNVIWMTCLWIIALRYQRIKGKSIGKRAYILLIVLTIVIVGGLAYYWLTELGVFKLR